MPELSLWSAGYKPRLAFESPQQMLTVAQEYFRWCDANPLYKSEQIKGRVNDDPITLPDGKQVPPERLVEIPLKRAYSKKGFCVYAGVSSNYLRRLRHGSNGNDGPDNDEWIKALDLIEDIIFNQQYEGAAAGQLNAAIVVVRGLGLADKIENKIEEVKEIFKIGDQEFEL